VNIHKVCVDEGLSFISESSGEILLISYQQRAREAQSPARCAQVGEILELISQGLS
jgi:hypothetical protein